MATRLRRLLWFGISTAIIVAMVLFADVNRFLEALRTADGFYLLVALFFGMLPFLVWSYPWYRFFQEMDIEVSYLKVLKMFMAGHFLNSITPLGQFGGEPFMAYVISRNTDASYERAFSTVFSADIINAVPGITFVLGGGLYLLLLGSATKLVLEAVYIALLVTVVGGSIVYLLWFKTGSIENTILRVLRAVSGAVGRGQGVVLKAEESLDRMEKSFDIVGSSPRTIVETAVIAHLSFLSEIFSLYFILLSLGFTGLSLTPAYFVLTLASIADFSPTPGGSGTYEAALAGLLTVFFPIGFATALVAAILFRLTTYWPGLAIGYITLNTLERGAKE